MCNACVIESVKTNMLSRRGLFRAAAAGAVRAAAVGTGALSPAIAAAPASVTDLTHELYEEFPTFFGPQQFFREQKFNFKEHTFNLFELRYSEHTGTHMDAPLHFSADGLSALRPLRICSMAPFSDCGVTLAALRTFAASGSTIASASSSRSAVT